MGPSSSKKAPKNPQTPRSVVEVTEGMTTGAEADLHQGSMDQRITADGEVERHPPLVEEEEEEEDSSTILVHQKRK